MSQFVSVLSDRDRVREHIEGCLKAPSKGQSVTGAQNHERITHKGGFFVVPVGDNRHTHSVDFVRVVFCF